MMPWTNKSISFGIAGSLLIILGAFLSFFSSTIFDHILRKELVFSEDSKSFNIWKDTSSLPPMYLNIYFFNWTNPEELTIPGKKPNLVQVGPYSFVEVRQKVNITFHPENDTVSYFQRRWWYFDQERTNGTLQDNITQLNVVAVSATHKIRYWSYFMQNTFSYILSSKSNLSITKTVGELLFTGYDDTIINMGKVAAADEVPPFDRFGWFYMRNGSTEFDGHFNMDTGNSNISNLGILRNWNYKDTIKYFKTPCNIIEGSAGEFWPPYQTEDEINLFSPDMCRPLLYEFMQKTTYMEIEGNQYVLGEKTLGNKTRRRYPHDQAKYFERTTTTEDFFESEHSIEVTQMPEDTEDPDVVNLGHCYCNGECNPSGLINITACRYGAPVFVSLPHFYKADPILSKQVIGMNSNEKDHSFYITLEPTTGIPLEVAARLQINVLLQPSKIVSLFNNVPKTYFPMFWFSMKVNIPEELASDLKYFLLISSFCFYIGLIIMTLGTLILISIVLFHVMRRSHKNHEQLKLNITNASSEKTTESIYIDKPNHDEDSHVRSDRRLYPKLY
ncbi:protein croquemort-like [Vespula maculifrons]|uniref:Protein croquemort-like n=1 Tax=Vespula maculifrons TaxID=7453 RepID=A0ABD2BIM5_VESMC